MRASAKKMLNFVDVSAALFCNFAADKAHLSESELKVAET